MPIWKLLYHPKWAHHYCCWIVYVNVFSSQFISNAHHVIDYQNVVVQYNVYLFECLLAHYPSKCSKCGSTILIRMFSYSFVVKSTVCFELWQHFEMYINSNRIKMIQAWYFCEIGWKPPKWKYNKPQHIKTSSHVEEVSLLFVYFLCRKKRTLL